MRNRKKRILSVLMAVCMLVSMLSGVILMTPEVAHAAYPSGSNLLTGDFDTGFDSGVNPFSGGTDTGGTTRILSFGTNKVVEFRDSTAYSGSGQSNSASIFTASLGTNTNVVQRINQIYNMPLGSDPVEFIYEFKLERTAASNDVVPSGVQAYIEFMNSDGGTYIPRFPTLQPSIFSTNAYTHDEPSGSEVMETVNDNDIASLRFRIYPNGGAKNITFLKLGFSVRVNTGATDEAYAVDDLAIYEDPQNPTSISLDSNSYNMAQGTTHNTVVTAVYSDSSIDVTKSGAKYFSSNTAVATVNTSGIVTAVANGTAVITSTYKGRSATANVTVSSQPTATLASPSNTDSVPTNPNIVLTFSKAMNAGTLTAQNVTLTEAASGIQVDAAYAVDPGNTALTITPSSSLKEKTLYKVEINNSVTDISGNAVMGKKSWTFATLTNDIIFAPNEMIISASSTSSNHYADSVKDLNQNSFWSSASGLPQTLTCDLGTAYPVSKIVMKLPTTFSDRTNTIAIQGSLDNLTYTDIVAAAQYSFTAANSDTVTVAFAPTGARYVRLNFTSNSARTGADMGELEIYRSSSTSAGIDLAVTNLTMSPASPRAGDAVTFSATVKNQGTNATPAGVGHKVAFKIDGTTIASSDNYTSSIAAGGSATLTATTTWTAQQYKFDISAVADADGVIGETMEDNNTYTLYDVDIPGTYWNFGMNMKDYMKIYDFPEEMVSYNFTCPAGSNVDKSKLKLTQYGNGTPLEFYLGNVVQDGNGYITSGTLYFRTGLNKGEIKRFSLQYDPTYTTPTLTQYVTLTNNGNNTATISGNQQQIMVHYGNVSYNNVAPSTVNAPVISISRDGGTTWVGAGLFSAPAGITVSNVNGYIVEQSPLFIKYRIAYTFSGGRMYNADITVQHNEKHVLIDETYSGFSSSDNVYFRFSYKNGVDPDGRAVMQSNSFYQWTGSPAYSGLYNANLTNGKLPYELGLYSVNEAGVMHATVFWNDTGSNAILFSVNRASEWKTEKFMVYNGFTEQNLRFFELNNDKYMQARIEGTERHWALSIIPRSDAVCSGVPDANYSAGNWTNGTPLTFNKAFTGWPTSYTALNEPGCGPEVRLWEKLSDFSLNKYKDMIFDFPEDTSIKLDIPSVTNTIADTANEFMSTGIKPGWRFINIPEKMWDTGISLVWYERGERNVISDYAFNRWKWGLDSRKQFRSMMVFLAYCYEQDDNAMARISCLGGHPNFNLDCFQTLAMTCGVFSQHPHAYLWKNAFIDDWNKVLNNWVRKVDTSLNTKGGRWLENGSTYNLGSMSAVLASAIGLKQYDGTDLLATSVNPVFNDWARWYLNSLAVTDYMGGSRFEPPVGAHSSSGASPDPVYGEFATIPEGIARQLAYSDKTLSDNLLWCVTKGAEGIRPNIESSLFTDYGPVMRYDVGGPHEAYLYLQQLNGGGYRWTPATNGTVYYSSKGQRWSWNGNEDNGDLVDANRLSVYSSSNGRQLGAHATDGVLYNFDFAQYYKALANSGNTPVLSRNVMMLRDDYIALYDDVSDESQNGTFKWSAREGGAYTEYYSNSDYTGLTNTGIRLQRFPLSDSAGAYGLPVRYVGTDTYSIKSTCKLFIPNYTGTYNFYVNSAGTLTGFNGTVQLFVNGTKVIDTTNVSQPFTPINLTGGQFVDVQLNYSHTTGSPNLALNWECVDSANPSIKLMNRTEIDLPSVYHQFDRQPSIYTVKGGAPGVAANGDQLHIVAPQALNVTNMDFGAVINASTDPQYVFSSDAEKNVADGMAVFTGKAGYAHKNELAIFEGTKAGINDFKIERSGGDFGFSAKYMDNNSITGRIAGKSGGTIYITPPYPFALNAVEVKVNGAFVGCTVNNGTIAFDVGISQADGYKTYTITTNGVTSAAGPVPTPTPTPVPAPMPLSSNLLVNNLDVGFDSGISPFSASSNTGASQQVVSIGGNNAVEFTDASAGTNSTSTFTATLNSSSTVVNRINQIYNMPVGSSPVEFLYSFKVERTKAASYPVPLNISAAIEFGNYDNINVPRFPVAESSIYNTSAYQHDEPAGSEVLEKVDYNDIAAFRFKITPNGGARNITSMMLKFNNRVNTGSTDEAYAIDDLSLLEILDTQAPSWNGGQLIASNPLQTSITLNWSGASDDVAVVDYQIFKDGQLLATTTNSSYVVTGLTQDTSYTFKIEARDAVGKVSTTGPIVTCSTSADKTVLNATISNAITALSGAVIGGQPGNYPESAVDALISAKLSALKVSNDPGSSQSTIDSQNTTLQNAINTFNSAIISGGPPPTPISLNVPNSGFETGTDSSADYWSLTNWTGSPAYSRVSDILHGGGYSAKINNAAYANGGWSKSTSSGRISVTAGKTHTVSIWTKTDNVSFNTGDGSYLSVQFYDSAGTAIGSATTSSTITGTVDWTKLSVTMSAPSNAASLRIDCRLKGTGTAWFDDVEVVQND